MHFFYTIIFTIFSLNITILIHNGFGSEITKVTVILNVYFFLVMYYLRYIIDIHSTTLCNEEVIIFMSFSTSNTLL